MEKISAWHRNGDTRKRRIFLWLPRTEYWEGDLERPKKITRWLEMATVTEEYVCGYMFPNSWVFKRFEQE